VKLREPVLFHFAIRLLVAIDSGRARELGLGASEQAGRLRGAGAWSTAPPEARRPAHYP
jgi:hypothetical protein